MTTWSIFCRARSFSYFNTSINFDISSSSRKPILLCLIDDSLGASVFALFLDNIVFVFVFVLDVVDATSTETAAGTTATTATQKGALVIPFFVYKPVTDSPFWVALLVLFAAVDSADTFSIAIDVHNVMK